ncbi:MAG: DEAD/DEAH box helicase [Nitriliruptoraceae bacterium]
MRRLALRRWQMDALDAFEASTKRDFLAVATPGAGKTTFALTAALRDLAHHPHRRVVVVTPTQHLKHQWSEAAAAFGLHLESAWSSTEPFPSDMHGVVVTYQQVAAAPKALRAPSDDGFVVLDELHHAGAERAWGDGVAWAFAPAARRLALSGTPFRSDTSPIPFVTYGPTDDQPWVERDEAVADHVYGYGDALRDGGVVRPVFFPRLGGQMEWTAPDGTEMAATFDDDLDRTGASQRLRTALSADGEWLPTVLDQAHEQLLRLREQQPEAGALAITIDREHAQAVARLLRQRHGVRPVVVTADEADASERISSFATSREPWIVAVRMVSEGVDIPRLRVGVYATTTVTELFFRQAVGRLVRWQAGQRRQKAFMFLPDDPRLRTYAAQLAESRTHSLKRREQDGDQPSVELDQLEQQHAGEDQLSLFQAISATPLDGAGGVFDDAHPEDLIVEEHAGLTLEIELAAPPPLAGAGELARTLTVSRTQRKREVRQENTDRVRMLTHLTGLTPEVINARLNQEVGLSSIAEASLAQLERRRRVADRWIDRV